MGRVQKLTVENFKAAAKQFNENLTVTITNPGKGGEEHWRIAGGNTTVSWWPFSAKGTAWCEGTSVRVINADIRKVLELTNRPIKRKGESSKKPVQRNIPCPECGKRMLLRTDSKFKSHGLWYACSDWPKCRGCHGAHPNGEPLGTPVNQETKLWRIKAHDAFDRLWKEGNTERSEAYRWLASVLGLPIEQCHIGSFDAEKCKVVIERCCLETAATEGIQ